MVDITATIAALKPEQGLIVGGHARSTASTFEVDNPATGEVIAHVADATVEDGQQAIAAAHEAFDSWRRTPPRQRAEILRRTWELMVADEDRLTALMVAEMGKTDADARAEVAYAAEFFRWFSEEAVRNNGTFAESPAGGVRTVVSHKPIGVAALLTPWNFPAAMATRKIAPALAAGCTVVLKPADATPLTALAVMEHLREAGVPDGVVNLVNGKDAPALASDWLADRRIGQVSFTGSTRVGSILLGQAAPRVLNTTMELGGNAPFIVTADAPIEAAVDGAMVAKFRNGGQACTAANRFFVHADVVDDFVAEFGRRITELPVGPGTDPANRVGPVISAASRDRMQAWVDEAVAGGAEVTHQARVPDGAGYWFPPTLVNGVRPDDRLVTEEIFGPVVPVVTYRDEDELIEWCNASDYGLSSYLYSGELKHAMQLAARLETGMVGINRGLVSDPAAPFGGVKHSGLGREGADVGMDEFMETQYYSVDWSEARR